MVLKPRQLIIISFLANAVIAYHQTDYQVINHRFEITNINPEYARNVKVSLVPFNRTVRVFNGSFELLADFKRPFTIIMQAYKFASNEYRLFPFRMSLDYCDMQKNNIFGVRGIENYSNLTLCPIKKGYYNINKYRPDESQYPPHLVTGDFKLTIQIMQGDNKAVELHWFGSIKPLDKLKWN